MSLKAVLLPAFVQVVLIFAMLFRTGYLRAQAIRTGETRIKDIALGQPNWPEMATQVANSYANQFQIPVLYLLLVAMVLPLHMADSVFVGMSWLFVVLRLAHAYVHITSNYVPRRFKLFVAGVIVVMLMWIIFAVRVLMG